MKYPNILFIVLDALKVDRCYGKNKTSFTPNIDKLIETGTKFKQVISSTDGTAASMASIFSGLHPFKSSIRGGLFHYEINQDVDFFPIQLKKIGYHTYATMPDVWTNKEFKPFFENKDATYPTFQRLHDGLGRKIIEKIDLELVEPWFYYIHLEDAHKPILYPDEFDKQKFGEDEYDRAISHTDSWLGKFLEKIDKEKTIVIVTSDHGDYVRSIKHNGKQISFEFRSATKPFIKLSSKIPPSLYKIKAKIFLTVRDLVTKRKLSKIKNLNLSTYEKRALFSARSDPKRFLYEELFKVPLIFSGFTIPQNKTIKEQIRSMDIFPTVFDLVSLPLPNELDGRSLMPLFKGEKLEEEPAYIESSININKSSEGAIGVRTTQYKYFRKVDYNKSDIYLFDLINDPLEENNIFDSEPKVVEQMEKYLKSILKGNKDKQTKFKNDMSDKELKKVEEELRKLGYI